MTPNCEKYTIDVTVCKDDLVRCLNAIIAIHGKDIVARCMVDSDEMCFEAETSLIHNCPKDCTMEDCDRCNEGMRDIKTNHRIKTTHCNVSKGYNAMLIPCGILLVAVQSMVVGDAVDITCEGSRSGPGNGVSGCFTNRSEEIWIGESGELCPSIEILNCIPLK
jgi:hypothetical protein